MASYLWNCGDGATGSGDVASQAYTVAATYIVTLTVTNDRGVAASSTKAVSVGGGARPTADFVFSPTPAVVNGQVYFDANASTAGTGHHLVGYKWNWGDGDAPVTVSSPTQQHDFLLAGTYQVTLTVIDESGQEGTASKSVEVGNGAPSVSFITAVTNAATHTIQADAGATSALGGATIASYAWSWGDGNTTPGGAAVQSHAYAAAGTYTVKLTVTDSLGRVGVGTLSVTVP
jgi:PKD repeat protein